MYPVNIALFETQLALAVPIALKSAHFTINPQSSALALNASNA
jgi:hypothetical protein